MNAIKNLHFTHRIIVPNVKGAVDNADGYFEELSAVNTFDLSQEEFEDLRKEGSLFDAFDATFGTIIDDCEEDRIESNQVSQAISIVEEFIKKRRALLHPGFRLYINL